MSPMWWRLVQQCRAMAGYGAVAAMAALAAAGAMAAVPCNHDEPVYIGTDGVGIRAARFDACTGKLSLVGVVADAAKSRWFVKHPQAPVLYAGVEGAAAQGRVVAYAIDVRSGALVVMGEASAGGAGTTHLWLDVPSRTLLAANFGSGSVSSIALQTDGTPGALVSTVQAVGSGPHRRQASPHAHAVVLDPSGRFALVPDLGADRVFVYGFDRANGVLQADEAAASRAFVAPAGSGPRRAVFGPQGRTVYLLSELSAEVTTLRWDAQSARLTPVQTLALSGAQFQGSKSGAELMLSRDGRHVYVANRGENLLVVYRADPESGILAPQQRVASGGEVPWALDIHPTGRWMLVAHHRSNRVNVFRIDPVSGQLTDTGESLDVPTPVSVLFAS